jgi:catechol 2,3-dioxygenase-like lactoylglutathione lyase family enzyme
MNDIGRIHHVGLTVLDLDRSIHFYCELLGCSLLFEQEKRGGYLADIVGYPGAAVRAAHVRAPAGGAIIELFEYLTPSPRSTKIEPARIGITHICLLVRDLERTYLRLVQAGVSCQSAPVALNTGINNGGKALYLADPDGIYVELFQQPGETDASHLGLQTNEH